MTKNKKPFSITIFAIILILFFTSCKNKEFTIQSGDLIFQVAENSAMSSAITEATSRNNTISYDHIAMIAFDEDQQPYIIEAAPKSGVKRTEFETFLDNAPIINGNPGVVVMRLNFDFPVDAAIENALKHIDEEYDWSYRADNGKMYCSELIYESYRYSDGRHIFATHPMSFRDAAGNIPAFWVELFQKLGEPIPEGEPGTNPNDISKDAKLVEVGRYF